MNDIFKMAEAPFEPYRDNHDFDLFSSLWDEDLDFGGACSDSCEIVAELMEMVG